MTDLLNDLSNEQAVNQAIEANMFSFWMNYGRAEGFETFEDERLMYFVTGLPHPLFNGVFRAQFTVSQIEPTIAEVIQRFAARNAPLCWWTGPATLPSTLGDYLQAHGLRGGGATPGMAVLLSDLPESVPVPDDFRIEVVEDVDRLRQWVEVLAAGNGMLPALHDALFEIETKRGIDGTLSPRRYLGFLGDDPVTASALHLDAGVAGIYAVATIPQARGKGVGTAITLQAYRDVRAMGYKVGVLQASDMGYSIYRRLGFKAFSSLGIYIFTPK